jgi:hypothetical protein
MSAGGVTEFVSSEFNIFASKPVQTAVRERNVVQYKPIASVDHSDLEFSIPEDHDTYIAPDIKFSVRGKLIKANGTDLDATDFTAGTNNLLHSLFSQCSVNITPATELYHYRAYLETLLTYGSDAANTHLTTSEWYPDSGDLLACDPTAADSTKECFITRWNRQKQSKVQELYGRLHSNICNVTIFLIPGVRLQIKQTKAKPSFSLMNMDSTSTTTFKFIDAELIVRRIKAEPKILLAHNKILSKGYFARYNLTTDELKTFAFSKRPQSLSINNAVLGVMPKRLVFTMVKNTDFLGTTDKNPFYFRHYDLTSFTLFVNGRLIPSESLSLDMSNEKTSVMGDSTLFESSGIHHSNTVIQITQICLLMDTLCWCMT